MDNTKFYDEAIALAKQAVEADTGKRWAEALDLYQRAVDRFVSGLKCECRDGVSCTRGGRRRFAAVATECRMPHHRTARARPAARS